MDNIDVKIALADLGVLKRECISSGALTDEKIGTTYSQSGYRYQLIEEGLTNEELLLAVIAQQAKDIKSIKSMITFFVILAVCSLALSFGIAFGL